MSTQRRPGRHQIPYDLEVVDRRSGEALGRLGDLSDEGMLLLTERSLQKGDHLELEIDLSPLAGFEGEAIRLEATVRWSGLDLKPVLFCAGLQFDPLSAAARALTDRLIRSIGFQAP